LVEVVAPDLATWRHEVLVAWILSSVHHVPARAFEVGVHDLEGAGAVPATDRLGVEALSVTLRKVRVDHGRRGAVQRDTPTHAHGRRAVDIHPIERDVVRDLRERGLHRTLLA